MMGDTSHSGKGEARSVLLLVSGDGHVWRRRWDSWVQRGSGADDT